MIDVVFLLLIFFMLVARFDVNYSIPILIGHTTGHSIEAGMPRLVVITPDTIELNGESVPQDELATRLRALLSVPEMNVLIRPADGVDLQRMVRITDMLTAKGITQIAFVE